MAESNAGIVPETRKNTLDGEANGVINIKEVLLKAVTDDTVEETCCRIIQAGVNKKYEDNKTALVVAIDIGCEQAVDALIGGDADIDAEEEKGRTPLMFAALDDHAKFTKTLIEKGADVSRTDEYGQTALHFAAESGHIDIVHLLIKAGADVDAEDKHGEMSLMRAAKFGHLDVVNGLLDAGASVNAQNQEGITSLMNAAQNGYNNIVQVLIAAGGDVSMKSFVGNTALNYAAEADKLDVVNVLTTSQIEVDGQNGSLALITAIEKGHKEIVNALIEGGADLNRKFTSEDTLLLVAIEKGNLELANMLMVADAAKDAPNKTNLKGETALHYAAKTGRFDVVSKLIECGAKLNKQDNEGSTPLMIALKNDRNTTKRESENVVNLLIEKEADINKKNMNGETALHFAAMTGHFHIVNKLLETSVDINAENKNRWTPLMIAVKHGHNSMAQYLIGRQANLNTQSKDGWTPLMISLKKRQINITNVLIDKLTQADFVKENKFGKTALHFAAKAGSIDIVRKLTEVGDKGNSLNKDEKSPPVDSTETSMICELGNKKDKLGNTALHVAAKTGSIEVVNKLIKTGARVNALTRKEVRLS